MNIARILTIASLGMIISTLSGFYKFENIEIAIPMIFLIALIIIQAFIQGFKQ